MSVIATARGEVVSWAPAEEAFCRDESIMAGARAALAKPAKALQGAHVPSDRTSTRYWPSTGGVVAISVRSAIGESHDGPLWSILWQFEQTRARSRVDVTTGPDEESGVVWWHSM